MAQRSSIHPQATHRVSPLQVVALDSRQPEQVVSDKQYLKILQMSDLLSRNLQLDQVLGVFFREIAALLRYSGYLFDSGRFGHSVKQGEQAVHSLTYHLTVEQMELGDLTVFRQQPFGSNEVCQLEDLLCALVYPLKNALMYQAALASAKLDPLTGTNNRAAMDHMLERELSLAFRHDLDLALIVVDLDGFKQVNDELGHVVGDGVLCRVSEFLQHQLRDSDVLFRYGGDEFVILLPQTDREGAVEVAERIQSGFRTAENMTGNKHLSLSTSIGVACHKTDDTPITLFQRADQAMYNSKRNGKDQVSVSA